MKAYVALCLTISILLPTPCFSADLPTVAQGGGVAPEICFPIEDGERMLKDLESLPLCQDAVKAGEDAIKSYKNKTIVLEDRIVEQDRELTDARKLVDDTRKAGEQAAKAASGPWYARILAAGKWIGLGIVLGFVAGAGK